jgi:transcriptional regulator with XRE-family HTH domain
MPTPSDHNETRRHLGDDPSPFVHSSELQSLVARLKSERIRRGLSLGDVARATELASSALSRLENGRYPNPTFNTVYRYAQALGTNIKLSLELPLEDCLNGVQPGLEAE